MTMKENQNGNSFDSINFWKETDPLAFGSKARYELNDSRMDSNHAEFEAKDNDGHSNFEVTDDSSMVDEKETVGSPKKAGQEGSHRLSVDKENGAVGSPRKKIEYELSHQLSIWDKETDSLSSDSSDREKEHRSAEHESFDIVEEFTDCNQNDSRDSSSPLFNDKNALECNLPDSEVCYEEIDCQILKDLCIDVARHQKDVNIMERCMDYIDHFEAEEDSSLDSYSSSTADQCRSEEENDAKTLLDFCLENSVVTSASFFDETRQAENDSYVEDSIVDGKLQIEDFGTQISIGTDGGNEVLGVPDQFLNLAAPESPAASSVGAGGTGTDLRVNCLSYNSNIENGSFGFNFSSPEGVLVGNVEEQSADKGDENDEILPDSREADVQCSSCRVNGTNGGSAPCYENAHEDHKQSNADDTPADKPAECTSESPGDRNDDEDGRDTGSVPAVGHPQQDMGETSFSAASLISYSGPTAFCGSLSHRSDGSTTSGKSFAFPILQSEWNSSPAPMAKADRRHFRKHKGWGSGVLCCRF